LLLLSAVFTWEEMQAAVDHFLAGRFTDAAARQRSFDVLRLDGCQFRPAQLQYAYSRSRGEHGDILPTPGDNPRRCAERARL
jgi:hypothetical protein